MFFSNKYKYFVIGVKNMDKVVNANNIHNNFGKIQANWRYSERNIILAESSIENLHIHDEYEIYLNISGKATFLVEGTLYPIKSGDIIITKPNEFHRCQFESDTFHKCYCVWLNQDEDNDLLRVLNMHKNGHQNLISPNQQERQEYLSTCKQILQEPDNVFLLGTFLFQVANLVQKQNSNTEVRYTSVPENMLQIVNYISQNYRTIESLEEIYNHFFVSPSTLNRYFTKNLHMTPAKFLETKRMANAKKLLAAGKSVTNACMESGFSDCSYFIALFKKQFGMTPGRYRDNFLK